MLGSAELASNFLYDKLIRRHYSAVGRPIYTKFGRLVQNTMPITKIGSKSKPKVEFQFVQYGGR